jgi:hypothetical protein
LHRFESNRSRDHRNRPGRQRIGHKTASAVRAKQGHLITPIPALIIAPSSSLKES